MKKEVLIKLGLAEDLAERVASASEEELKGYVAKNEFDNLSEAKASLETQLAGRDRDIAELKKTVGDNAELTHKLEELQGKYKTDTETLSRKLAENVKNNAIDMAILAAKGKNPKAIKALLDMDKITVKEDGTLEGLDLDALKESDGYLFAKTETAYKGNGFRSSSEDPAEDDFTTGFMRGAGIENK